MTWLGVCVALFFSCSQQGLGREARRPHDQAMCFQNRRRHPHQPPEQRRYVCTLMAHEHALQEEPFRSSLQASTMPVLNSDVMCVMLLGDRTAIDVRGDAGHGQGRADRVRTDLPGALLIVPSTLIDRFQSFLTLDRCCTHRRGMC